MAKRHDSQPRFVLDLTRVNRQTVAISYPLPSLDSVLDTMSDYKPVLFSSLVLRHGYWQIKLEEESREKTGFVTSSGGIISTEWVLACPTLAKHSNA